ncbi:hypothetical protein F383_15056 [Gossypium arboreum]
MHTN